MRYLIKFKGYDSYVYLGNDGSLVVNKNYAIVVTYPEVLDMLDVLDNMNQRYGLNGWNLEPVEKLIDINSLRVKRLIKQTPKVLLITTDK